MPVVIKKGNLQFNNDGSYVGVDVLAERKTEEVISAIEDEGETQIANVQAYGEQVRASLPSEYTELYDEVTGLRNDIVISETQPTSEANKLWIKEHSEEEYTIPTYEEFDTIKSAISDYDDNFGINEPSTYALEHDTDTAEIKSIKVISDWNIPETIKIHCGKNYRPDYYFPVLERDGVRISSRGETLVMNGTSVSTASLGWQIIRETDIPTELIGQSVRLTAYCNFEPPVIQVAADQRIRMVTYDANGTQLDSKSAYFETANVYKSSVTFTINASAKTMVLWWYARGTTQYQDAQVRILLEKASNAEIDTGITPTYEESVEVSTEGINGHIVNTTPYASVVEYMLNNQHSFDNMPNARMAVYTPEMFGASGIPEVDDSGAIQACIDAAVLNGKTAILNGVYYTKETIHVNGPCTIIGNVINYSGEDTAIKLHDTVTLQLREILGKGNGITLVNETGKEVTNLRIDIGRIKVNKNCIEFAQVEEEIPKWWYCEIHVGRMISGSAYACIKTKDTGTNLNDVNFFVNSVNGGWGISGSFGNCKFYNFAFEELAQGAMRLVNSNTNSIIYPRLSEITAASSQVPFIKFIGKCSYNTFMSAYNLKMDRIDVSEMTKYDTYNGGSPNTNIFHASKIVDEAGYDVGDSLNATELGVFARQTVPKKAYDVTSETSWIGTQYIGNSGFLARRYPTEIYVRTVNATIHLPRSYCLRGINEFIVCQGNGKKATIIDSNNNTIFDGTTKSDGVYKLSVASHGVLMSDGAYAVGWSGKNDEYTKWCTIKISDEFSLSYDPIYTEE